MVLRKLCYVIVVDDEETGEGELTRSRASCCYTQSVLQSLLQLVGCKANHAVKISERVFDILEREILQLPSNNQSKEYSHAKTNQVQFLGPTSSENIKSSSSQLTLESDLLEEIKMKAFHLYKHQASVTVKKERFVDSICRSLEEYRYVGPSQRADILLACRLRERKDSVTILLCGTSGCGKSTLSSLLASRLGITTVVSTDSIRHMMRSFICEKENPLLWASTYHAGEFLDPVAVAKAKARKDRKLLLPTGIGPACSEKTTETMETTNNTADCDFSKDTYIEAKISDKKESTSHLYRQQIGSRVIAIEGYKAQSEMVIDSLNRLITAWEDRKESVVVEGVHLSLNFVMGLMRKHRSIIPFLIYIADEEKHLERFAIRAKYMTLDPSKNKYVKYIKNIRTIQDYLFKRADKHLVPKVDNTNVDRSVASIHSTIFSCLRRRQAGISLYDSVTNTAKVVHEEYCKQCDANPISSKGMFQMIQRQGSLRQYMAIIKSDGSVTKAWPFSQVDKVGLPNSSSNICSEVGSPIYGPLQVREARPVNVQFGNFGFGSWPNDIEGTSNMSSIVNCGADRDGKTIQRSSSSSSRMHPEGHAKELTEEVVASESDEEQLLDEDDDSSETTDIFSYELGGSVTESPVRSDEEYEEEQNGRSINGGLKTEEHKISKGCARTVSMKPPRIPIQEGHKYKRYLSLPSRRSHSSKTNTRHD